MRSALTSQTERAAYQWPALPRLPEPSEETGPLPHNPLSQIEVYFAAAEVAEEFGHLAMSEEYCHDCYTRAAQCLRAALNVVRSLKDYDRSYVMRCYQRCACHLEERLQSMPQLAPETTKVLTTILEEGFSLLQQPVLPLTHA